jgi:ribosomal protein S18 acetylase RimI-like enzyme
MHQRSRAYLALTVKTRNEGAVVELAPMSGEQFEGWKPTNIADYAKQHTIGGKWTANEALRRAREEFELLLPEGTSTPGHRFFSIVRLPDRTAVGMLWIKIEEVPKRATFIFMIEIFTPFRRRGFASQAMTLLEKEARREGVESINLHVFGHNKSAQSLYNKLGYVATNIQMRKRIARAR